MNSSEITTIRICLDPVYAWETRLNGRSRLHFMGMERGVDPLKRILYGNGAPEKEILSATLAEMAGNFAVIVEGEGYVLAAVDKVRGYPIFYANKGRELFFSNSARHLQRTLGLGQVDETSLLEFHMGTYVTGRETLFHGLYQIQAGEYLLWEKGKGTWSRNRYYAFYSPTERQDKEAVLIEELADKTNSIFQRIMETAGGRPIWIPLSGGLDSRLIACKLTELGYDNIQTFSYGPAGNFEAKAAKAVAERLNIPWFFLSSSIKEARAFFHSETRKRYWEFSDGLCSLPFMQDITALHQLKEQGKLPEGAVIINGQSGDFITGGHLSHVLESWDQEKKKEEMIDALLAEHFSWWHYMETPENVERLREKMEGIFHEMESLSGPLRSGIAMSEYWEWQERQSKFVVNGQRAYDFFNLDWFLPLWDKEYMDFWPAIPANLKFGQLLYKKYLWKFDYRGVFSKITSVIWRWPGVTTGIVPVARAVGLILGKRHKERVYDYFKYWGHYRNLYSVYPYKDFVRKALNARNADSFFTETWMEENLGEIVARRYWNRFE